MKVLLLLPHSGTREPAGTEAVEDGLLSPLAPTPDNTQHITVGLIRWLDRLPQNGV